MNWFDLLSLAFSGYGVIALFKGSVRVAGGPVGQVVSRDKTPKTFWFCCLIYILGGLFFDYVFRYHWAHLPQ